MLQKKSEERDNAEMLVKFIKNFNARSVKQTELESDFCSIADRPSWARCAVMRRRSKIKDENLVQSLDWISDSIKALFVEVDHTKSGLLGCQELSEALCKGQNDCLFDYNSVAFLLQKYDRSRLITWHFFSIIFLIMIKYYWYFFINFRKRDGIIYYDEFITLFNDLSKKYIEINENSSDTINWDKMSKLMSIKGILDLICCRYFRIIKDSYFKL